MTVQSDIDTTMGTLRTNIAAFTAAGRPAHVLTRWLIQQLKLSDPGVARFLTTNGAALCNAPHPGDRTLANADNTGSGA